MPSSTRLPAASLPPPEMTWPKTPSELIRVQRELARLQPAPWRPPSPRPLVAACFVCFARGGSGRGSAGDAAWAGAALVRGSHGIVGTAVVRGEAAAPYEPGLLALREGRLLELAVRALPHAPEVVIANATGRDHPEAAGLALHLGAVLELPSIGVTDRPLLAAGPEPGPERGAQSPVAVEGIEVARLLRTRSGARPVVIHSGWRTDIDTAVAIVLGLIRRARTPEPLRRARRLAREARAAQDN